MHFGRDRFHACFGFWLLAALLVSLVPSSALVLCAVHKGRIELALIAGFNDAAVRYKVTCCNTLRNVPWPPKGIVLHCVIADLTRAPKTYPWVRPKIGATRRRGVGGILASCYLRNFWADFVNLNGVR